MKTRGIKLECEYPVTLEQDGDTVLVTFVDLPAATFGDEEADALARAVEALETVLAGYIADRKDIPQPSAPHGRVTVAPTLIGKLKLAVYQAMRDRDWRKSTFAFHLGLDVKQVDRLLDMRHGSTVAQLERALATCGRTINLEVEYKPLEAA